MEDRDFHEILKALLKVWQGADQRPAELGSIPHQYLGTGLLLRGWYVYAPTDKLEPRFAGVARVELNDNCLNIGGIRLYDGDGKPDVRFWTSEFTSIVSDKELLAIYRIYDDEATDEFKKYFDKKKLKDPRVIKSFQGGKLAEGGEKLLHAMNESFDDDLETIRRRCEENSGPIDKHLLYWHLQGSQVGGGQYWRAEYRQIAFQKGKGAEPSLGTVNFHHVWPDGKA